MEIRKPWQHGCDWITVLVTPRAMCKALMPKVWTLCVPFRCGAVSQIRQLFVILQDRSADSMTEIQQMKW